MCKIQWHNEPYIRGDLNFQWYIRNSPLIKPNNERTREILRSLTATKGEKKMRLLLANSPSWSRDWLFILITAVDWYHRRMALSGPGSHCRWPFHICLESQAHLLIKLTVLPAVGACEHLKQRENQIFLAPSIWIRMLEVDFEVWSWFT